MPTISVDRVRFVKELYPRIKPNDDAIERYRDALEKLPPIVIARDGVLVDGYHRWQAHVREGIEQIQAEDLGNLSDAEIMREAITRNASHGQQLSVADKRLLSAQWWKTFDHLEPAEREQEIASLLSVTDRSVRDWTKDARKEEQRAIKENAWRRWLSCEFSSFTELGKAFGIDHKTAKAWCGEFWNGFQNSPPSATGGWGAGFRMFQGRDAGFAYLSLQQVREGQGQPSPPTPQTLRTGHAGQSRQGQRSPVTVRTSVRIGT